MMIILRLRYIFLFLLQALVIKAFVYSQELPANFPDLQFEHITTDDGLLSGEIRSILQDSKGFIWFGTVGGLNRYDGSKMKSYLPESNNPQSIPYITIDYMIEDHAGKIWLIGEFKSSICRYDPEKDIFTKYTLPDSLQSSILSLYEDSRRNLWLNTLDKGILRFNRDNQIFEKFSFKLPEHVAQRDLNFGLEDSLGNLWLGFAKEVFRFSWKDSSLNTYLFPAGRLNSIFKDSRNELWIGGEKRIMHYNQARDQFEESTFVDGPGFVNKICQDNEGFLWLGAGNGLYIFDPKAKKLLSFSRDDVQDASILDRGGILQMIQDKKGGIWIGTKTDGVFYWNGNRKKIHAYQKAIGYEKSVSSFAENSEGKVWISMGAKPILFDPMSNSLGEDIYRTFPATFIEDEKRWIWSGTWFAGVTKFHPDDGHIYSYYPASNWKSIWNDWASLESNLPSAQAPYLIKDHKGVIWVLIINHGYYFLDTLSNTFKHYPLYHPETKIDLGRNGRKMYEDAKGNLWTAVEEGLIKITSDRSAYSLEEVSAELNEVFHEDSDGYLWGSSWAYFNIIHKLNNLKYGQ